MSTRRRRSQGPKRHPLRPQRDAYHPWKRHQEGHRGLRGRDGEQRAAGISTPPALEGHRGGGGTFTGPRAPATVVVPFAMFLGDPAFDRLVKAIKEGVTLEG